jgi:dephospho-CoA kinase
VTVRIGITGPIGCGKSTVAGWLGERPGVVVIDADAVVRGIVEPGTPTLDDIVERFGPDALAEDGTLDRARLGRIVFGDATALADLEAITGPPARARIRRAIEAAESDGAIGVVIEAIRLLDGGLATVCDEVWLVTCDPAVQMERLAGRGTDPEDAARRIEAQAGLVERVRPAATRVIDTSGSLEATRADVDTAFDAALRT